MVNRKNWKDAVKVAKMMLAGRIKNDNTHGATHYYNPKIITPYWAKKSTWKPYKLSNMIHVFGLDTSSNWSKTPVIRKA